MQTAGTYRQYNRTTEAHTHNKGLKEMAGKVVTQTVVLLFNVGAG
jgi:hypothetical protein